jgi:DNA modification methylase
MGGVHTQKSEENNMNIPEQKIININELQTDGNNPNKMTEAQHKALQKSIEKYGFIIPIITNKDLVVADGEQRLTVAKKMGLTKVPVITLQIKDVDRRILRQVLNKLKGMHDDELDAEEFKKIIDDGGLNELSELLAEEPETFANTITLPADDDNFTIPEKPKYNIEYGEVWELGEHKLICGDSTDTSIITKIVGKEKATLCFTSPPYNMNSGMYLHDKDNKSSEEYIQFNMKVINNITQVLEGFIFWNISYNKNQRNEFIKIMNEILKTPLNFLELIVWDKGHSLPINSEKLLRRQYEDIIVTSTPEQNKILEFYYLGSSEKKIAFNKRTNKGISNYWRIPVNNVQIKDTLLACFPVALPAQAIQLTTKEQDIILDPFLGSGSTLIACEQLQRKCYGVELDPYYCSVIIERWEAFTKKKARKINNVDKKSN